MYLFHCMSTFLCIFSCFLKTMLSLFICCRHATSFVLTKYDKQSSSGITSLVQKHFFCYLYLFFFDSTKEMAKNICSCNRLRVIKCIKMQFNSSSLLNPVKCYINTGLSLELGASLIPDSNVSVKQKKEEENLVNVQRNSILQKAKKV